MSAGNVGSANDALAYLGWSLRKSLESLLVGYYVVGDNAYVNTTTLLAPFTENQIISQSHNSFNFYLSQLRIRVEKAFGLIGQEVDHFSCPLLVKFERASKIVHATRVCGHTASVLTNGSRITSECSQLEQEYRVSQMHRHQVTHQQLMEKL